MDKILPLLQTLRTMGVKSVSFDPVSMAPSIKAIEFFSPMELAQDRALSIIEKEIDKTPDKILKEIRAIEEDAALPEIERKEVAAKLRAQMFYGSSE